RARQVGQGREGDRGDGQLGARRAPAAALNGAESLIRTLLACGVDTCFTNPGTSEMHFVAALDRVEGMRCVLALFEGVVTGAADIEGIARACSRWVKTTGFGSVAADAAAAVAESLAPPGGISTLILPADVSWSEAAGVASLPPVRGRAKVDESRVRAAADALR